MFSEFASFTSVKSLHLLFPRCVLPETAEIFPCTGHEDVWRSGNLDLIILKHLLPMEESGQLHYQAASPTVKFSPALTNEESGWAPQPVWALYRSDETADPVEIEASSLNRPARTLATTAPTPRRFLRLFFRWRYSPLWALACRTTPLHFSLSVTNYLHLLTPST